MKFRIIALPLVALLMSRCGPSQQIIGSWSDPQATANAPYKKVFVIVLSQNKDANYYIETQMSQTLVSRGFQVVQCTDIFPPNFSLSQDFTREQLAEALQQQGCDAVLTLALLDTKTVETYKPGTTYYPMNYGYYGSYYGYYNYYYPQVYSPGYYSVDKTYYLEANLYDRVADKLLWSVQSEAKNPKNLDTWFKEYSTMLINHLKSKGLNQR
jgi:hypothetical protein